MGALEYLLYCTIGLIGGFLGGLFGIGGGVIIVPSLLFIFYYLGYNHSVIMSIAAATSLSTMIFTTFISTRVHLKKKTIEWKNLFPLIPFILIGCSCGVWLSTSLHSQILSKVFGVVVFLLGIYIFFPKIPRFQLGEFLLWKKIPFALFLGFLSSLLGIGGGIFAVPLLMGFNLPFTKASGISAFVTFSTALIGTIGYLIVGWNNIHLPHSLGYINVPAFALISLGTMFTSSIGTKVAYIWPVELLKKIFSVVLLLTGVLMFFH